MSKNEYINIIDNNEKRELIWKLMIGGSSVKDVKKQEYTKFNSEATPTLTKKLLAGKILEEGIINLYNHDKNENEKIKITKDIFISLTKPFLSANIDGFVGENLKNAEYVIEVKNTNTKEISKLVERYKHQANYYCWFFNVQKCKFLFLIDGWDLQEVWFEYDKELFEKDIENYLSYLHTKWEFYEIWPLFKKYQSYQNLIKFLKGSLELENFENSDELENELNNYLKIKNKLTELTKLEKETKEKIDVLLPENFEPIEFNNFKIERKKRETISYKESFYLICQNFSIPVNQNQFIQKNISESLSIMRKKEN